MLHSGGDRHVQEYFIDSRYPTPDVVEQVYNFLLAQESDPIELTQQEVREALHLEIQAEGVGQCEQLLEKAGALRRLEPNQNMAMVWIHTDEPSLVELLPKQARNQRRVLRCLDKLVGDRRRDGVYIRRAELAAATELDDASLTRALNQLRNLEWIEYVPPFRGRAISLNCRETHFAELSIDFEALQRRRGREYQKLRAITQFAESEACRQQEILQYFGERSPARCGQCDNCRHPMGPRTFFRDLNACDAGLRSAIDQAVRKTLAGVARAKQRGRLGRHLVAQMLCGSRAKDVIRLRLDKLSTYGILAALSRDDVIQLIDALLATGCLESVALEPGRPVIELTEMGEQVMRGEAELEAPLKLSAELCDKLGGKDEKRQTPPDERNAEEESRFVSPHVVASLRRWRSEQANAEGVPSFHVLTNSTLHELASSRPTTLECLAEVKGIGPAKMQRYGERLLEIVGAEADPTVDEESKASHVADELPRLPQNRNIAAQPSYYWTWLLLSRGFSCEEAAAIRGIDEDLVWAHAFRAAEERWEVELSWFLTEDQRDLIAVNALQLDQQESSQLPSSITPQHVRWFLACRRREVEKTGSAG